MKFKWYLHENYMDSEIEECLMDKIGDHPDMETIINQLKNITYEYTLNLNWDADNKKLTVESK